ncbi:hypothetical protein [Pelagicoccus sp. SDUM812003]|uniref:hypothetical protein n=1 Tax=Pelagicoccus sp. SDUM812003 TaxID=3041267 RepID=UPI00280D45B1|nr:hypothetical protein [Pelagicoccus sp. SDUM812003]MDQ8202992.1 hypothetical protein [Pelagicoccus sp. SDUM812003]
MKSLQSKLKTAFVASSAIAAPLLLLSTLPALSAMRATASASIGISETVLSLLVTGTVLGCIALIYRVSIALAGRPFEQLAQPESDGKLSPVFQTRSRSAEEDALKRRILEQSQQLAASKERSETLEKELSRANARADQLERKAAELSGRIEELEASSRKLKSQNETLQSSKVALELTLENERKSKVGVEVEKRTEEIYAQLSNAVSAASFKAVWVPSMVNQLRTPIALINQQAARLHKTWDSLSFTKVKDDILEIQEQSELQIKLLDELLKRETTLTPSPPVASNSSASTPSETSFEPQHGAASQRAELRETPLESQTVEQPEHAEVEEPPALFVEEPPALDLEPMPSEKNKSFSLRSEYDLIRILDNLTREFSLLAKNTRIEYAIDEDLEVELTDSTLLNLLHGLVEIAVDQVSDGSITIGVDLQTESIQFDVACQGNLKNVAGIDLRHIDSLASELKGKLGIDAPSATELHLSFDYRFEAIEDAN